MKHKIIKLAFLFVVLFSLQGFSQTTEKSKHPLLDKYYPQKQNTDTGNTVPAQINPAPETKPMASTPAPVNTTPAPAVSTTPAVTNTTTVTKPTTVKAQVPVQKVTQPAPPPYMDTRLGSSTKQYDTWEKNNNGAGSVTTNTK